MKWNRGDISIANGIFTTVDKESFDRFHSSEYLEITPNSDYTINLSNNPDGKNGDGIFFYDENKVYIGYEEGSISSFTTPPNSRYIIIRSSCSISNYDYIKSNIQINFSSVEIDGFVANNNHKSYKTTLLLPCQLMKVDNVADRLYWDSEKCKYIVEKNVFEEFIPKDFDNLISSNPNPNSSSNNLKFVTLSNALNNNYSFPVNINNLSNNIGNPYQSANSCIGLWQKDVRVRLDDNKETTVEEVVNKLLELNGLRIYVKNPEPQLIETNVTEQIFLSCYKDKTHLFVTGGIDGGVQAKFPLDGGKAIQDLSTKNIALKETNDTQDVLINTTMLATDEMFTMLEPLLSEVAQVLSLERSVSKMVDMYVAMVQRGLKTIEQVPARYREEVRELLAQLEK